MTKQQQNDIIRLLLRLAKSDGNVEAEEKQFIFQAADALNINLDDIDTDENKPIVFPKTEQERMTVLYYLLFMMNADGKITQQEIEFVKRIGFRLGFRSRLVEDMMSTISQYPGQRIPPEALLNNIKKYLN